MPLKIIGTISHIHEGGIDLLALQVGVLRKGFDAKAVLDNAAVLAKSGTSALVNQDITVSHPVGGKPQNGDMAP